VELSLLQRVIKVFVGGIMGNRELILVKDEVGHRLQAAQEKVHYPLKPLQLCLQ